MTRQLLLVPPNPLVAAAFITRRIDSWGGIVECMGCGRTFEVATINDDTISPAATAHLEEHVREQHPNVFLDNA